MNIRRQELYYDYVSGMTVKITQINKSNGRIFKVLITTGGILKGGHYSPPIPETQSFVNVDNLLLYIKRQTECSDYELSKIKSILSAIK